MTGTRKWWALGALALSMLAVGLDTTIINIALPTLATDLHATTAQLQWFVDAYSLVLAALLLPAGLLGDRFGRKKLLLMDTCHAGEVDKEDLQIAAAPPAHVAGRRFIGGLPMKPATNVVRGRRYTSSGGASWSSRPLFITATRSASAIASDWS